jgi:hypothetical protein
MHQGDDIRDIRDAILLFELRPHIVRQLPGHLGRVHAAHVLVQALPLGHPRVGRVSQSDEALKDLGRAALDLVG